MPRGHIGNRDQYEALKKKGLSKTRAAKSQILAKVLLKKAEKKAASTRTQFGEKPSD